MKSFINLIYIVLLFVIYEAGTYTAFYLGNRGIGYKLWIEPASIGFGIMFMIGVIILIVAICFEIFSEKK